MKVKESVADLDHVLRRIEGLGMVLIRVELERHALRDLGRRSIGVVRENRRGGGCRALTDLVAGIARLTRRRGGRSLRGIAHLHRSRIGSVRASGSAVWLPGPLPRLLPRLRPGALNLHLGDFLGEHRTGPTEDGLAHEQDAHQHDKRLPSARLHASCQGSHNVPVQFAHGNPPTHHGRVGPRGSGLSLIAPPDTYSPVQKPQSGAISPR